MLGEVLEYVYFLGFLITVPRAAIAGGFRYAAVPSPWWPAQLFAETVYLAAALCETIRERLVMADGSPLSTGVIAAWLCVFFVLRAWRVTNLLIPGFFKGGT